MSKSNHFLNFFKGKEGEGGRGESSTKRKDMSEISKSKTSDNGFYSQLLVSPPRGTLSKTPIYGALATDQCSCRAFHV